MKMSALRSLFVAATFIGATTCALADDCKIDCGKVTAVDTQQREGQASGVGAVAGGLVGGLLGNQVGGGNGKTVATIGGLAGGAYLGHQVEKKSKTYTVHVVTVLLDGGTTRTFTFNQKPQFIVGDRTQVNRGKLERYAGK